MGLAGDEASYQILEGGQRSPMKDGDIQIKDI